MPTTHANETATSIVFTSASMVPNHCTDAHYAEILEDSYVGVYLEPQIWRRNPASVWWIRGLRTREVSHLEILYDGASFV